MRIILHEIRKLLNWKLISLLILLSFLFYHLFLSFDFTYFPNGRPSEDDFKVSKQMIAKYGSEMEDKKFVDFKKEYDEEVESANDYLQSHDRFSSAGVTTYKEFRSIDEESSQELNDLYTKVMFTEGVDIFWELQARENIIENYEFKDQRVLNNSSIQNEKWKTKWVNSDSKNAILPNYVLENYTNLIAMLAILIVLSVMIIVSRIHIIDQKNNTLFLQYTTFEGRNLFKKKLAATMITSVSIVTIYLSVFFIMYAQNETSEFFSSSLYSFESYYFWFDITFLEYIILSVMCVYLLALIVAAIATLCSRIVANYISLIGAQIPFAVILILLIKQYLVVGLLSIQYPVALTVGTYLGLVLLSYTGLFLRWKREQKVDIV